MYAAEDGENQACQEGHRDRQQSRQDPVKGELYELKKRVAADPHRVQAVHGTGFCDHVLKLDLESEGEQREHSQGAVTDAVHPGVDPKHSVAALPKLNACTDVTEAPHVSSSSISSLIRSGNLEVNVRLSHIPTFRKEVKTPGRIFSKKLLIHQIRTNVRCKSDQVKWEQKGHAVSSTA